MSLTLNPTLASAQDSQSHHPIVEIKSAIAFPRSPFRELSGYPDHRREETQYHRPQHGALFHLHLWVISKIRIYRCRTDRFHIVDLTSLGSILEATLVEQSDGNIGIVFYAKVGPDERLYRVVLSPTGTVVVASSQILSYTTLLTSSLLLSSFAERTQLICWFTSTLLLGIHLRDSEKDILGFRYVVCRGHLFDRWTDRDP